MLELSGQMDLAAEPLDAHPGRQLRQQHLDDHLPLQRRLQRQEDARHPPAAELALDAVDLAQRSLQLLLEIGGHGSNVALRRSRSHRLDWELSAWTGSYQLSAIRGACQHGDAGRTPLIADS
jgi:hypothetical protein